VIEKLAPAQKYVVDKDIIGGGDLTIQEMEMIERLSLNKDVKFVKNALDQKNIGDIDLMIHVLQNIKRYKDPNMFRIVPEYLDKAINIFGLELSESALEIKKNMSLIGKYDLVPSDYIKCATCGKHIVSTQFLMSDSIQYNGIKHAPFCNECILKIASAAYKECVEDIKEAIMVCCYKLDIMAVKPLIDETTEKTIKDPSMCESGRYIVDYLKRQSLYLKNESATGAPIYNRFTKTNFGGTIFKNIENRIGEPLYDEAKENHTSRRRTFAVSCVVYKLNGETCLLTN
jgi:hypothetical protein